MLMAREKQKISFSKTGRNAGLASEEVGGKDLQVGYQSLAIRLSRVFHTYSRQVPT
jgi:hypothetical protein